MTPLTLKPDAYSLSYGVCPPLVEIDREGEFTFHTPDAHGFDQHRQPAAGSPNPLVGPIVVREARPGQALAVTIEVLEPDRTTGWASCSLHPNLRLPGNALDSYQKDYVEWEIDLEKGTAWSSELSRFGREIDIPLRPMLGCLGVAPGLQETRPSIDCGRFGGNMDYPRIQAGVTLYLPVLAPGAYLFAGDGHAVQGAGEITGNGVEVSCAVGLRVGLVDMHISCPRGEDEEVIFCVGNAEPLEQAIHLATHEMKIWLGERYGLDERQVGMLIGQQVNYEIGNLVSHGFSVACTMQKRIFMS